MDGEDKIDVYLGLDVGNGEHHGTALTPPGKKLLDKPLPNSEPRLRELFEKLQARHGTVLVVVDQPASIGALPLAVDRDVGCHVAYLPGLTMRRIADLYPGEAKTDARDAAIIADAARTMLLAARIEQLLEAYPLSRVLTSMPGVGVTTAARILIDVGDGSGFAIAGHLAAYAGLAPATRRSGPSLRGERPARRGNKQLKRAFYLAAFASLSQPHSRAYYDKKRREGKHHVAALVCLARRGIDVLFAMLRDGTFYEPPKIATA
ncbi:transposase [Streptomyces sp. NPDC052721]|uniref:IS110 family transposase n=1 Tax=Streptomyces sp. NPDC052721 TaxID=3154955 RepID=UPI00343CCAA9